MSFEWTHVECCLVYILIKCWNSLKHSQIYWKAKLNIRKIPHNSADFTEVKIHTNLWMLHTSDIILCELQDSRYCVKLRLFCWLTRWYRVCLLSDWLDLNRIAQVTAAYISCLATVNRSTRTSQDEGTTTALNKQHIFWRNLVLNCCIRPGHKCHKPVSFVTQKRNL